MSQIAAVIATMNGEHAADAATAGTESRAASLPIRERLVRPRRPRYSSTESTKGPFGDQGGYLHEFWLPESRPDGSEEPGHLRVTAYLDDRGLAPRYGNAFDRYHYLIGAGLVDLQLSGFGAILDRLGFTISCTGSDKYWNRHRLIRIDYPSAMVLCERANELLAGHAARTGKRPLELVNVPRGEYSPEFFINLMADRRYPISQEYDTPAREADRIDHGSHDVLAHAVAAMILSGTSLFDNLEHRAGQLRSAFESAEMHGDPQMSARRYYMGVADRAISAQTFAGLLRGDREARLTFSQLTPSNGRREDYIEEIRQQITNPREAGWLA